jgi:hypothetical protein
MNNLKALHAQARIDQLLSEFSGTTARLPNHVPIDRPHVEFDSLTAVELGFKPDFAQRFAA